MDSGIKPLKLAKKYDALRNTISTWLLPGNREEIIVAFQSSEVSSKRESVRVRENENFEKELFN